MLARLVAWSFLKTKRPLRIKTQDPVLLHQCLYPASSLIQPTLSGTYLPS